MFPFQGGIKGTDDDHAKWMLMSNCRSGRQPNEPSALELCNLSERVSWSCACCLSRPVSPAPITVFFYEALTASDHQLCWDYKPRIRGVPSGESTTARREESEILRHLRTIISWSL